jgi:uncharacterized membrane protein
MLQTLLFVHLLAVVTIFSGLALELASFFRLHRATTLAEVRAATLNVPLVGPLMGIGVLLLLGAGIALVYVGGFGWAPSWVNVTFVVTLILAINGPVTNGKRSEAIRALALQAGDGPVTPEIQRARCDRFLNYSVFLSACALFAALYVMTTKPGFAGCVAALVIAAIVAIIPTVLVLRSHATVSSTATAGVS